MLPSETKAALRAEALARRDALDHAYRAQASRRIMQRVLALRDTFRPGPISLFWPIRSEFNTRPLLAGLAKVGHVLALPGVPKPGLPFRAYGPGAALHQG